MKRLFSVIVISVAVMLAFAAADVRYFVGRSEVPADFWLSLPDSVRNLVAESDMDSVVVRSVELKINYVLDSVTEPGKFRIAERPREELERLLASLAAFSERREGEVLKLRVGDVAPQFSAIKNQGGAMVDGMLIRGKCYLLTFWATWCGNCLKELRREFIPAIADSFIEDKDFRFVPICIDADTAALSRFFATERGRGWSYLQPVTFIDVDRRANACFTTAGIMPLNVVVGKDGRIKYIHTGAVTDSLGLSKIRHAIEEGLE